MFQLITGTMDLYSAAALIGVALALCIPGSIWLGNRKDYNQLRLQHELAMKKQADDRDAIMFCNETERRVKMASAAITVHSTNAAAIENNSDGEG